MKNKLDLYKDLLLEWNKTHNLSGAKDHATLDAFVEDALYPLEFLPHVSTLLDIGSGAGFPAIPLALALSSTEVTLCEPLVKRASFLQFVKAKLLLDNVRVLKDRVENIVAPPFDLITSRAVMPTSMLLELSKNVRNSKTLLLLYKGERVYDDLDFGLPYRIIKTKNRHYLLIGESV